MLSTVLTMVAVLVTGLGGVLFSLIVTVRAAHKPGVPAEDDLTVRALRARPLPEHALFCECCECSARAVAPSTEVIVGDPASPAVRHPLDPPSTITRGGLGVVGKTKLDGVQSRVRARARALRPHEGGER